MRRKSVVHKQVYKHDQVVSYAVLKARVCRVKGKVSLSRTAVPLKQKRIIHCATRLDY